MSTEINSILLFESGSHDPYRNIAAEKLLGKHAVEKNLVLYLWQNRDTVVIGKNQNPWSECSCELLESDGCKVARRLSGGGAVWHDLGNLNYSFVYRDGAFERADLASLICKACRAAGADAEVSGRNDIQADGRKISGTAFYSSGGISCFHGCLLVSADKEKMARYLTPDRDKLALKGVRSVSSRVANLSEYCPGITVSEVRSLILECSGDLGRGPAAPGLMPEGQELEDLAADLGSWEHIFGETFSFTFSCSERFSWGSVQLQIGSEHGRLKDIRTYTDAMDPDLPEKIAGSLRGVKMERGEMFRAMRGVIGEKEAGDLAGLISGSLT